MPIIAFTAIAVSSFGKVLTYYERLTQENVLPETKILHEESLKRSRAAAARDLHTMRSAKAPRRSLHDS
jgi:hypothetical protein